MAKLTIGFGVLLTLVGIVGYFITGGAHAIGFGVLLVICGVLANTENTRRRMIWMHIAVTIGLLGFLVPGTMSTMSLVRAHSGETMLIKPASVHEQIVVALLCLVYVALCVRSFIAARRARTA